MILQISQISNLHYHTAYIQYYIHFTVLWAIISTSSLTSAIMPHSVISILITSMLPFRAATWIGLVPTSWNSRCKNTYYTGGISLIWLSDAIDTMHSHASMQVQTSKGRKNIGTQNMQWHWGWISELQCVILIVQRYLCHTPYTPGVHTQIVTPYM